MIPLFPNTLPHHAIALLSLDLVQNLPQDALEILQNTPPSEPEYWEAWDSFVSNASYTCLQTGSQYRFHWDGSTLFTTL